MKQLLSIGAFVIICQLLLSTALYSQPKRFFPGNVVLTNGEVMQGQVQELTPLQQHKRLVFVSESGQESKYSTDNANGYTIGNEEFVKKQFKANAVGQTKFVKVLVKGKATLYLYRYGTELGDATLEKGYLLERGNELVYVNRLKFKKATSNFFADDSDIQKGVKSNKYALRHLQEMVELYNSR